MFLFSRARPGATRLPGCARLQKVTCPIVREISTLRNLNTALAGGFPCGPWGLPPLGYSHGGGLFIEWSLAAAVPLLNPGFQMVTNSISWVERLRPPRRRLRPHPACGGWPRRAPSMITQRRHRGAHAAVIIAAVADVHAAVVIAAVADVSTETRSCFISTRAHLTSSGRARLFGVGRVEFNSNLST